MPQQSFFSFSDADTVHVPPVPLSQDVMRADMSALTNSTPASAAPVCPEESNANDVPSGHSPTNLDLGEFSAHICERSQSSPEDAGCRFVPAEGPAPQVQPSTAKTAATADGSQNAVSGNTDGVDGEGLGESVPAETSDHGPSVTCNAAKVEKGGEPAKKSKVKANSTLRVQKHRKKKDEEGWVSIEIKLNPEMKARLKGMVGQGNGSLHKKAKEILEERLLGCGLGLGARVVGAGREGDVCKNTTNP